MHSDIILPARVVPCETPIRLFKFWVFGKNQNWNLWLLPSRMMAKLISRGLHSAPQSTPNRPHACSHVWPGASVASVCDWPTREHFICWLLLFRVSFGSDRLSGGTDLTLFKQHASVTHCWNTSATQSPNRRSSSNGILDSIDTPSLPC